MYLKILIVLLGGGLGSVCRYGFSVQAAKWFGGDFPIGTLGVNLAGCFLIGFIFALAERSIVPPAFRLFIVTGFLGGLTTFSTYALECANFSRNGCFLKALTGIALNNLGGLVLAGLGLWLGRAI